MLPLKTNIYIPIVISYIVELQRLKFGFWVVTSNLQTSIQLDLSKKSSYLQLQLLKSRSHFLGKFEEIGCGKLRVKTQLPPSAYKPRYNLHGALNP